MTLGGRGKKLYSNVPRAAGAGDRVETAQSMVVKKDDGSFMRIPRGAKGVVKERRLGIWKTHRVQFSGLGTFWVGTMDLRRLPEQALPKPVVRPGRATPLSVAAAPHPRGLTQPTPGRLARPSDSKLGAPPAGRLARTNGKLATPRSGALDKPRGGELDKPPGGRLPGAKR